MKTKIKKYLAPFFLIAGVIIVFTFVDYLFHIIDPEYAVPDRYFRNKVIFGTIYSFIIYFFVRKLPPVIASLILALVVSSVLQIRYYFEGYGIEFVILFLGIHFFILWPISWIFFEYKDRLIKLKKQSSS